MNYQRGLVLCIILCSFSCSLVESRPESQLVHVILLWLKEPGNLEHRRQFIVAGRRFVEIPGVVDLRIGQAVSSNRKIVDDSFDVGLYVIVEDKQALQNYLTHPIHIEAVDIARPIAKKFLAYDFIDRKVSGHD